MTEEDVRALIAQVEANTNDAMRLLREHWVGQFNAMRAQVDRMVELTTATEERAQRYEKLDEAAREVAEADRVKAQADARKRMQVSLAVDVLNGWMAGGILGTDAQSCVPDAAKVADLLLEECGL